MDYNEGRIDFLFFHPSSRRKGAKQMPIVSTKDVVSLARGMVYAFAILFVFCAMGVDDTIETFIPRLWAPLFLVCAVSTFLLAVTWSIKILHFTGVLIPCVFLGRLYAVIDRIYNDPNIDDKRIFLGIGVYGMLTISTIMIWGQVLPRVVDRQGRT